MAFPTFPAIKTIRASALGGLEVRRLGDGYGFRYQGTQEWTYRLIDFILTERECCPFLTMELQFEPDGGSIWLKLRGSSEIMSYVGSLINPQAPACGR